MGFFEQHQQQEDYFKPKRVSNFYNNNILNIKVNVIEIKTYH